VMCTFLVRKETVKIVRKMKIRRQFICGKQNRKVRSIKHLKNHSYINQHSNIQLEGLISTSGETSILVYVLN